MEGAPSTASAIRFGGATSDRIATPANSQHNTTTAPNFTFATLVYPTVASTGKFIFSKCSAGGSDVIRLKRTSGTAGRLEFIAGRATTNAKVETDDLVLNKWQWIVGVCAFGGTQVLRLYIAELGGPLKECNYVSNTNGSATFTTADGEIVLGNSAAHTGAFEGDIARFWAQRTVLNMGEIQARINPETDGEFPHSAFFGLNWWFRGTSAVDVSGKGFHPTTTGCKVSAPAYLQEVDDTPFAGKSIVTYNPPVLPFVTVQFRP